MVGIYSNSVLSKLSSTPVLLIILRSLGSQSTCCERQTKANSSTTYFLFTPLTRRYPSIVLDWPVGFCFGPCQGAEGGR